MTSFAFRVYLHSQSYPLWDTIDFQVEIYRFTPLPRQTIWELFNKALRKHAKHSLHQRAQVLLTRQMEFDKFCCPRTLCEIDKHSLLQTVVDQFPPPTSYHAVVLHVHYTEPIWISSDEAEQGTP